MKVAVIKLNFHNEKAKKKVMEEASGHSGVVSVAMDQKEKKLTVTGDIDAVELVNKLTKLCPVDLLSVGPLPKKKQEPRKVEPKRVKHKKVNQKKKDQANQFVDTYFSYDKSIQYPPSYTGDTQEDPKACVIC